MKSAILILISLLFAQTTFAQLEKSIHQTFELDTFNQVNINLQGEVEIEKWAGNTIMAETKIKLYDASAGILSYFVKEGRYEIISHASGTQIELKSKDVVRKPIQTKNGQCFEEVMVKIYMPEDFESDDSDLWTRKEEATEEEVIEEQAKVAKDTLQNHQ